MLSAAIHSVLEKVMVNDAAILVFVGAEHLWCARLLQAGAAESMPCPANVLGTADTMALFFGSGIARLRRRTELLFAQRTSVTSRSC